MKQCVAYTASFSLQLKMITSIFIFILCISSSYCKLDLNVHGAAEFRHNDVNYHEKELSNSVVYDNLKKTIASVKKSCGEICDQSIKGEPGKYFDSIKKKINCDDLFNNPDIDDPSQFKKPPKNIPNWLLEDFSYSGRVNIEYEAPLGGGTGKNKIPCYYDDSTGKHHFSHWEQSLFDIINANLASGGFRGPYGKKYSDMLDDFMKNHVDLKGKHVMVVGSHTPWLEVMALRNGAKKVLSVDYNEINSDHPQVETMPIMELNKKFLNRTLPQFDVLISYSSVEHSGLGRYGDNLNPWGDVIAMARGWCLLKPGGRAMIGVPTKEKDTIYFNGSRHYGPVQYPHLFANWNQIHSNIDYAEAEEVAKSCYYCYQPLVVAEKPLL